MEKTDERNTPAQQGNSNASQPAAVTPSSGSPSKAKPNEEPSQAESPESATGSTPKKALSRRAEVKDQRTIVRKRDKALLAALGVFVIVMAAIAVLGILLIHAPKEITQGQADCDQVRVSGKLPGRVTRILVREGDYVHKGDTLVAISSKFADASLYKAQNARKAAEAANQKVHKSARKELRESQDNIVKQAKAAEEIAKKTYDRMQNLYQEGVVTQQRRDEAKAAYDIASAAVHAAEANQRLLVNPSEPEEKTMSSSLEKVAVGTVREVEAILEDQVLLAPCDGEVSEIYPHEGELVSLGTPIMSISKLDKMWVAFNVREDKLSDFSLDTTVEVTIPALKDKKAKLCVYYIHDMGSYAVWNASKAYGQYDSKTFEIKCRPIGEIEGFRPGMSVILKE